MGDTGNGYLSAVGVMQALYHREKTGEGQFVDTSIVNAGLLNTSYAVAKPDGTGFERPHLDGQQFGFDAGHRLYETAAGWICVVCATDDHVRALASTVGVDVDLTDDAALAAALTEGFKDKSAADWFAALDVAGVPAEVESETFGRGIHDDPMMQDRGWVVSYQHPHVGKLDQVGMNFDLSETPGKPGERPLIVGEHTKEILASMGYSEAQMDEMEEQFAIGYPGMPRMPPRPAQ